jgi:V8-like Glu-specific endopeptidase
MRIFISLLFIFITSSSFGQSKRIICYDFSMKSTDTIEVPNFDSLIQFDNTQFSFGKYNSQIENLPNTAPDSNLFKNSKITKKRQASRDFNIENFPLRTTTKLLYLENDSLKQLCTGTLISRKHVLSSGHCVTDFQNYSLRNDSILICPIFDNGIPNTNFQCSWVKKIYFFEHYDLPESDLALLELSESIGENSGWVSIGFDSNDSTFKSGTFYKFSYPGTTILYFDSNTYNGDTLYYSFGTVDSTRENIFGVKNARGIPGESGSSLIKIENNENYISYGTLSLSYAMIHSRITNWKYFALKSIISKDLTLSVASPISTNNLFIFPNPCSDILNIRLHNNHYPLTIKLYSINGQKVFEKVLWDNYSPIDIANLSPGIYILTGSFENQRYAQRIIKE